MINNLLRSVVFLAILLFSHNILAEYRFSLGMGFDYSGFGARAGKVINESTLLFGSAGLLSVVVNDTNIRYNWSYGLGMLSNLFVENKHHSIGGSIVRVYDGESNNADFSAVLLYEYSLDGLLEKSWNFGVSILVVENFYKSMGIKMGYQF